MATPRGPSGLAILTLALAAMTAMGTAGPAAADLVPLTDLNSSVTVNTSTTDGAYAWTVDGVNHLAKQWFWYRVGPTGGERSIDTLTQSDIRVTNGNFNPGDDQVVVLYTGAGFTVTVQLILTGGSAGSGTSSLGEAISIHNTSEGPLSFHFFQYADFDVAGTAASDTAQVLGGNTAQQQDGYTVTETVVTQPPSHYEVGLVGDSPNLLARLFDTNPTTLGDIAGPKSGDAAWAFQWDQAIAPGGTLIISKTKHLSVPEPMTVGLLALGGLGLAAAGLRRRSAR